MSDFDAARKRLERHADELAYVAEQDPHYGAEEALIAADIRLLLNKVERLRAVIHGRTLIPELVEKDRENLRLRAEVDHAIRYGNAQRAIVVKLDAEVERLRAEGLLAVK